MTFSETRRQLCVSAIRFVLIPVLAMTLSLARAATMNLPTVRAAPPEQDTDVTLRIINESDQTICSVQIAISTATVWGGNWLEEEQLAPGDQYDFVLSQGTYHVRLLDCEGNELLDKPSVLI